ncbi:MAG: RnfABCDGE type electron transport complex subunit G [Clostridiales bacterium]|nr:RnfABCDGE type electron transport complex subunit G [Clostridiales bacterium]
MPTAFGYGKRKGLPQKKQKGSVKQIDAVKLFVITLLAGLILGGVYQVTKTVIEENENKAKVAAYQQVCPGAVDFVETDSFKQMLPKANSSDMFADGTLGNVLINEALMGVDAAGNQVGYVVNASSKDGFGGEIILTVGFDAQLKVKGIQIMTINETAGLGMKAKEPEFMNQFKDKLVEQFAVTKIGAQTESDINALSGATITSKAVTGAVNAALKFIHTAVVPGSVPVIPVVPEQVNPSDALPSNVVPSDVVPSDVVPSVSDPVAPTPDSSVPVTVESTPAPSEAVIQQSVPVEAPIQ